MNIVAPFLRSAGAGFRGGLSIALALSVPVDEGRSWILGTTYIVVVFSIVIQGGSMDLLLRRFSAVQNSHELSH